MELGRKVFKFVAIRVVVALGLQVGSSFLGYFVLDIVLGLWVGVNDRENEGASV